MLERLRGLLARRGRDAPLDAASTRALPLASAALLVGGAGVAFWWYTQWAHGRSDGDTPEEAGGPITPVLPQASQDALSEGLAVQAEPPSADAKA